MAREFGERIVAECSAYSSSHSAFDIFHTTRQLCTHYVPHTQVSSGSYFRILVIIFVSRKCVKLFRTVSPVERLHAVKMVSRLKL